MSRRGEYRPIDVLTLSGVELPVEVERRAVAVPVDFWGGITGSSHFQPQLQR